MTDIFLKHKEFSTQTCNALGCYNTATLKIVLPVGAKSLTIFVCQNCKPKFENWTNMITQSIMLHSSKKHK